MYKLFNYYSNYCQNVRTDQTRTGQTDLTIADAKMVKNLPESVAASQLCHVSNGHSGPNMGSHGTVSRKSLGCVNFRNRGTLLEEIKNLRK